MFEHIHSIHLIGANGVGVSAVGKLFLTWGKKVSGSDLHGGIFSNELARMGAKMKLGHAAENVPADADLVVYSSAVPETNPERQAASDRGIVQMSFAEFLGELAKGYTTIAVTGTHGKSTTTAMIGKVLEDAGLDPTVIVGSRVPGWPLGNLRTSVPATYPLQPTPYLIIEACEHMAHHLKIFPDIGVITNVEFDHPDFYRDLAHVEKVMRQWEKQCGRVVHVEEEADPKLKLKVPGAYNQRNAAGALAAARLLELDEANAKASLEAFSGIWRRFEHVGVWHAASFANDAAGADVYSDYGHHPTAIRETLKTARELFPHRRLVHIFQPHQHVRTAELFDEFVSVLGRADVNILVEIYSVAGRMDARHTDNRRTDGQSISSKALAEAVNKTARSGSFTHHAESLDAAETFVRELTKPGDVLFFQGAGDIDDVARRLVS